LTALVVNVVGCSRNNALSVGSISRNLRRWNDAVRIHSLLVLEGPSTDGARELWEHELGPLGAVIVEPPPGLQSLKRADRLAKIRNFYLDALRNDADAAPFTIVMDFDNVNEVEIRTEGILRSLAFLNEDPMHAACFAVQENLLFDVWALRHPIHGPDDCWQRVESRPVWMSFDSAVWSYVGKRQRAFPIHELTEVESAFGGLGLYRTTFLLCSRYKGLLETREVCEHVALHAGIRAAGGRLFVCPWLRNNAPQEHLVRRPQVIDIIRKAFRRLAS
jgi:hypothetical protein